MLVCRAVFLIDDCAMLRAEDSDMLTFGRLQVRPGYLLRLTRMSIRSEPVWNTLELAV